MTGKWVTMETALNQGVYCLNETMRHTNCRIQRQISLDHVHHENVLDFIGIMDVSHWNCLYVLYFLLIH